MNTPRTILFFTLLAVLTGCASKEVWKHQAFSLTVPAGETPSSAPTNIVSLARVRISPRFQTRSFVYRVAPDTYEEDSYAGFLDAPEGALAESIRAILRQDGQFGRVTEPGSAMLPSVSIEATVNELDGDMTDPAHPTAVMSIHFVVYEAGADGPGRVLLDRTFASRNPMLHKNPAALVAGWDAGLRDIINQLNSEYAKAHTDDRGR